MNKGAKSGGRAKRGKLGGVAALSGICFAAALAFALLRKNDSLLVALGDALVVESLFCFGLSWVGYLKKDGIRIVPPKKRGGTEHPESWKDRVPQLDREPPSPSPIPGPAGPESADYLRLVEAEKKLRRRILGVDENPGIKESVAPERRSSKRNSPSLPIAGVVLFLLGLFFEYILPALLLRLG